MAFLYKNRTAGWRFFQKECVPTPAISEKKNDNDFIKTYLFSALLYNGNLPPTPVISKKNAIILKKIGKKFCEMFFCIYLRPENTFLSCISETWENGKF